MKKIQVGARIDPEDAEFLNLLEINGAKTPSDKLRAIIQEARLRRAYSKDFTGSYRLIQEQVTPIIERLRKTEFELNVQSVLLTRILEWMPEFYAYSLSALPENIDSETDLAGYEKGVVDRVMRLFESLLHVALSRQRANYQPELLENHVSHIVDLVNMIQRTSEKKEG